MRNARADSLNAAGRAKNRLRSALVNTGGDSKASSSEALKIFMRAMGNDLAGKKWTTIVVVGMIANVKADLLLRERFDFDDGAILEIVTWRVPEPVVDACVPTGTGCSMAVRASAG